MRARTWRGWTSAADADAYVDYLKETGFREYQETPGNRGVFGLRRIVGDRAEFLLVTLWESDDAIRAFAGDDPDQAVFYPEDDRFLVDRERHVDHYDLVFSDASRSAPTG